MHLPPPNLPRFGGGERPPFSCKPPAPLTITMGQRPGSLQALTFPERRTAALISSAHPGPFPASGKGVGGKGRCAAATLGAILCAVRIDFRLPPKINPYPAQPATGVLGQRPKRVLVPFTRVKGTPRRVGVLIRIYKRLAPPLGDNRLLPNGSRGLGRGTAICRETPPPKGNCFFHYNSPLHRLAPRRIGWRSNEREGEWVWAGVRTVAGTVPRRCAVWPLAWGCCWRCAARDAPPSFLPPPDW